MALYTHKVRNKQSGHLFIHFLLYGYTQTSLMSPFRYVPTSLVSPLLLERNALYENFSHLCHNLLLITYRIKFLTQWENLPHYYHHFVVECMLPPSRVVHVFEFWFAWTVLSKCQNFYMFFENELVIISNVQICILDIFESLTSIGKPKIVASVCHIAYYRYQRFFKKKKIFYLK